jgi:CHASE domain
VIKAAAVAQGASEPEPEHINHPALGLDLASEQTRKQALEAALSTGLPTMTGKIILVQDAERRPGFLLFVPVYRKLAPVETAQQRRAALEAWVYGAFITEKFLKGIVEASEQELERSFFQGASVEPGDEFALGGAASHGHRQESHHGVAGQRRAVPLPGGLFAGGEVRCVYSRARPVMSPICRHGGRCHGTLAGRGGVINDILDSSATRKFGTALLDQLAL